MGKEPQAIRVASDPAQMLDHHQADLPDRLLDFLPPFRNDFRQNNSPPQDAIDGSRMRKLTTVVELATDPLYQAAGLRQATWSKLVSATSARIVCPAAVG